MRTAIPIYAARYTPPSAVDYIQNQRKEVFFVTMMSPDKLRAAIIHWVENEASYRHLYIVYTYIQRILGK